MKIISTVPSITELLSDLQLDEEVVGITKFCVHPEHWFRNKTRIGGTKNLKLEKIKALDPDLIVANKEENLKDQIEYLEGFSSIYLSDIQSPLDNISLIRDLGKITDRNHIANNLIKKYISALQMLEGQSNQTVLYLIWKNPWMAAGGDSYIHSILHHMGLNNVLGDRMRYPELNAEEIKNLNPDLIFLSSEPFPFKEKHKQELLKILPKAKIHLVDGEYFSWYGSRLIHMLDYGKSLKDKLL